MSDGGEVLVGLLKLVTTLVALALTLLDAAIDQLWDLFR